MLWLAVSGEACSGSLVAGAAFDSWLFCPVLEAAAVMALLHFPRFQQLVHLHFEVQPGLEWSQYSSGSMVLKKQGTGQNLTGLLETHLLEMGTGFLWVSFFNSFFFFFMTHKPVGRSSGSIRAELMEHMPDPTQSPRTALYGPSLARVYRQRSAAHHTQPMDSSSFGPSTVADLKQELPAKAEF